LDSALACSISLSTWAGQQAEQTRTNAKIIKVMSVVFIIKTPNYNLLE
jgi:hypothetical protein